MNGPALFPYQIEGAKFLASKERACIFDSMGLGKSAQLIRAADTVKAKRIIVVCPAAVRQVWVGEFKRFAQLPRKVLKAKSIHDLGIWLRGKADVLLISYELATSWADKLAVDLFDLLIIDEGHYAKNHTAQRTRALFGTNCDGANGIARWAARTWIATGTPMANDPIDIWPILRFVKGTPLNITPFTTRYFKSRQGTFAARQTPREEMIPELRMAIDAVSIRRTQKDIGFELPPILLTDIDVDGDTAEIRSLLREWPGLEQAIIDAIEQGGLSFLDAQHIATLRRLVGTAKAPAYAKLVAEELKNGRDKMVIFAWHTQAAETITSHLMNEGYGTTLLDGSTPESARVDCVRSFQNDPEHRVFVANMKSGGTGLTLTAACHLDMFESSWSPADNAQAIKRVHRIGQGRSVTMRFIRLANSIDSVVSDTVERKTAAILSIENYGEEAA